MQSHSEKFVEEDCELTNRSVSDFREGQTPCIDDHQLSPEDLEARGELQQDCAQCIAVLVSRTNRTT